ncbi:Na+/H+ antiporter [Sphingomonas antarctica]|uniref:cation:proton antiporter n=1 Tax=Sphingomonas antarctica TaxID=2040274 RepID=UPI0039ECADE1
MSETVQLFALPLAAIALAVLSVVARVTKIAAPIVLLLGGMAIAFVPGMPPVHVEPQLVLITLLPPILYSSGVGMSWRGFRSNLRAILLLAIGCVIFTASAVAGLLYFVMGMPLAVGFVLGAIVSPPDAVAPAAVLRDVAVPRRVRTVLEGESLINDATALVAFSFAVGAVATGAFEPARAALSFIGILVSETIYGCAIGWIALKARHYSNDPRSEVLLALATPYLAFLPAHELGGSGVIATVVAGLWVSWNGRDLIRPQTRLQGYFIWDLVAWGVEGAAFLLTGLQVKALGAAMQGFGWVHALAVAALTCVTVVVVRFAWVFPATYLPRMIPAIRRIDPPPHWRTPFFVASAGVRGVVSMIAALSIPLMVGGKPFPERDTLLFATFAVIVMTMLGIGPFMGTLARLLGLTNEGAEERKGNSADERRVRRLGIEAVLAHLDTVEGNSCEAEEIEALKRRHGDRLHQLDGGRCSIDDESREAGHLQLDLIEIERRTVSAEYLENRLTDGARRRIERELDLEEARVHHAIASIGGGH